MNTDSALKAPFDLKVSAHITCSSYLFVIKAVITLTHNLLPESKWCILLLLLTLSGFSIWLIHWLPINCSAWRSGSRELPAGVHQGVLSGQPLCCLLCQVTLSFLFIWGGWLCSSSGTKVCMIKKNNNKTNLHGVSCRFASVEKKACQDSCQHTSCSSCLMLTPPSCPHACSPTDSTCLQHFGKCVHSHLRMRPHVCHSDLQVKCNKNRAKRFFFPPSAWIGVWTLIAFFLCFSLFFFFFFRKIATDTLCVCSQPAQTLPSSSQRENFTGSCSNNNKRQLSLNFVNKSKLLYRTNVI